MFIYIKNIKNTGTKSWMLIKAKKVESQWKVENYTKLVETQLKQRNKMLDTVEGGEVRKIW